MSDDAGGSGGGGGAATFFDRVFGETDPKEKERRRGEREAYRRSRQMTDEENEEESQRAKDACLEAFQRVVDCQKNNSGFFGSLCTKEANAYFRCYRRERGFFHVKVLGMNVDASKFIGSDDDDDNGGDAAARPSDNGQGGR